MINPVIIFGAKSVGMLALDAFLSNEVLVYGFLDDDHKKLPSEFGEFPLLGAFENEGYTKLIGKKCDAIVAVDEVSLKKYLVNYLIENRKTAPVNAVHNKAYISSNVSIGHGNVISYGVYLAPFVNLGSYNVVGTHAIIETGAKIGNYSTIQAGAIINSNVQVGDEVFVGAGAVIVSGVTIGKKARIGAGSVVVENVPDGATVFGNPAKKV